MDGHSGDAVASKLDLPGVDAGTDLDVERPEGVAYGEGALDGATGTVEGRQEAIAGGIDLPTAETLELLSHRLVMALEQVAPVSVAEPGGPVGGTDDVGEQDGGQDPFGAGATPDAGDELLDLVEHRTGLAHPVGHVGPGQLDVPGSGDVLGEVAPMSHA